MAVTETDVPAMDVMATDVLARKIAAARTPLDPALLTPERAVALALARAQGRRIGLMAEVTATVPLSWTTAELLERLPDHALLATLDGPDDALGLVALDPALVAILVERMTLGRVAAAGGASRRPTRTDAAMIVDLIGAFLDEIGQVIAAATGDAWARGFRYAAHIAEPRPLALMLDAPCYRTLTLRVTPDGVERTGTLLLALPADRGGVAAARPAVPVTIPRAPSPAWEEALAHQVLGSAAEVRAILARVTLPLAGMMALSPGQSILLPGGALGAVQIEGAGGALVGFGVLGQGAGVRALRLLAAPEGAAPVAPAPEPAEIVEANDQPLHRAPPAPAPRVMAGSGDQPQRAALAARMAQGWEGEAAGGEMAQGTESQGAGAPDAPAPLRRAAAM